MVTLPFIIIIIFFLLLYVGPASDHFSEHLLEHPCLYRSREASLWDSPPLQGVFLLLSGWKPMGAHVGGQDAAGQCVSLRSQFTLIILVSVCYHPYVCRELGFINMNMSPKLTVVTAAVSRLICTSSGCSHHFKAVAPDTTPFLWITNYYKVISAVLNFKKSEC